jgi:hypothetical protein
MQLSALTYGVHTIHLFKESISLHYVMNLLFLRILSVFSPRDVVNYMNLVRWHYTRGARSLSALISEIFFTLERQACGGV